VVQPIDDKLVKALKEHRTLHPSRRLVFTTPKGKPERHFLAKLKAIALREWCGLRAVHIEEREVLRNGAGLQ
jgi:hypothetical protein